MAAGTIAVRAPASRLAPYFLRSSPRQVWYLFCCWVRPAWHSCFPELYSAFIGNE